MDGTQDTVMQIVDALRKVTKQEGETKALQVIDDWIEHLTQKTGENYDVLRNLAHDFVKLVQQREQQLAQLIQMLEK